MTIFWKSQKKYKVEHGIIFLFARNVCRFPPMAVHTVWIFVPRDQMKCKSIFLFILFLLSLNHRIHEDILRTKLPYIRQMTELLAK
eukprot:UN16501